MVTAVDSRVVLSPRRARVRLSLRREFIAQPDKVKRILIDNCTDLERNRAMQGAGMPNLVKMLVQT